MRRPSHLNFLTKASRRYQRRQRDLGKAPVATPCRHKQGKATTRWQKQGKSAAVTVRAEEEAVTGAELPLSICIRV
jgi:hypothetical protein